MCIALCHDCRERYYTCCDRCGTLIHNEQVYEYDDEYLCRDCYDELCDSGPIHEYDYTPELIFHGKGLRRFGVELEIDEGGKSRSNANRFLEIANRDAANLYVKSDGSLDDGSGARHPPDDIGVSLAANALGGNFAGGQTSELPQPQREHLWASCPHLPDGVGLYL